MICDGMCYLLACQSFGIAALYKKTHSYILTFLLFSMVGPTTEKQLRLWRLSPFFCEEHSTGWNILYCIIFVFS